MKAGRRYLADHGIDAPEIIEKYRLGVVIDPLPGDERFTGMLCVPYLSRRGGVKAVKYRAIGDNDGPKCQQYQGQSARLFNTFAWFQADDVIGLAEGEPDAICATENLYWTCRGQRFPLPTIGIPGAETWAAHSKTWRLCFRDVRTVFMFCHGDKAGRELGRQVAETLGWRVRLVEHPDGADVSSMVALGLTEWFDGKLDVTEEDEEE